MIRDVEYLIAMISVSNSGEILFQNKSLIDENSFFLTKHTQHYKVRLVEKFYQIYNHNQTVLDSFDCTDNFTEIYSLFRAKITSWIVEHENYDGSIIATDGNNKRFLKKGEYIFDGICELKNIGKKISFFSGNSYENESFFCFYHHYNSEFFPESIIRIYFNVSPKHSQQWIDIIARNMLSENIFLQGKCLKNNLGYDRTDSAVLYIKKKDLRTIHPKLKSIFEDLKKIIRNKTPLFTLKLQDGIGFAENPPNPNESFGMSRCRLIAEGIWQAYENNLPKAEWTTAVINYIESQGYDLEKFYLNPHSRFPYDFDYTSNSKPII